jgi:predicted XRE-type DNA-binding protein
MNDKQFGQTYYAVLQTIKDSIEQNLVQVSKETGLSQDQLRKVIHVAQSSVDQIGGNAFNSLIKSGK